MAIKEIKNPKELGNAIKDKSLNKLDFKPTIKLVTPGKDPGSKAPEWFKLWSDNVFIPFVKNVNERFDRIEKDIRELKEKVSSLEARVSILESKVEKIESTLKRNNIK